MLNKWAFLLVVFCFVSCTEHIVPKPKALLRLEYPDAKMKTLQTEHFDLQINEFAQIKNNTKNSIEIDYPLMKGSVYINYHTVNNNLNKLLSDAQKFSYEHVVKADDIVEYVVINKKDKVYGMIYEVSGNAASQAQFYATDSIHHFVTGSLYFYAKPNYDSIYPAANYLQKDIRRIMESLQWKN